MSNTFSFKLTNVIFCRKRRSDVKQIRYEIFGNELGQGTFGKVSTIIATLSFHRGCLVLSSGIPRVVKEIDIDTLSNYLPKSNYKEVIVNEYALQTRYKPGAKMPVILLNPKMKQDVVGILIMKYVEGQDLDEIYNQSISTDKLIKIAIAILIDMKFVHDCGITHGDIKPENIKVNLNSPLIPVNIMDFGNSRDSYSSPIFTSLYTPIYAAKEVMERDITSPAGDYFAAGLCLLELFRAARHPMFAIIENAEKRIADYQKQESSLLAKKNKTQHDKYQLRKIKAKIPMIEADAAIETEISFQRTLENRKIDHLFQGIRDLDSAHKHSIKAILKQMVRDNPYKRASFANALIVFEQIDLERRIKRIKNKESQKSQTNALKLIESLTAAHISGINIREKLAPECINNFTIRISDVKLINELIVTSLEGFVDEVEVITLFIDRLQVQCLVGMQTKHEIEFFLTTNKNKLKKAYHELEKIHTDINELTDIIHANKKQFIAFNIPYKKNQLQLDKLKKELLRVENKKHKSVSVDNIHTLSLKLGSHNRGLKLALERQTKRVKRHLMTITNNLNDVKPAINQPTKSREYLPKIANRKVSYSISSLGFFSTSTNLTQTATTTLSTQATLMAYATMPVVTTTTSTTTSMTITKKSI